MINDDNHRLSDQEIEITFHAVQEGIRNIDEFLKKVSALVHTDISIEKITGEEKYLLEKRNEGLSLIEELREHNPNHPIFKGEPR